MPIDSSVHMKGRDMQMYSFFPVYPSLQGMHCSFKESHMYPEQHMVPFVLSQLFVDSFPKSPKTVTVTKHSVKKVSILTFSCGFNKTEFLEALC